MASHAEFDQATEALDAAKAFPDQIKGKTIIVTGVSKLGIGFTTAQAFASQAPAHLIIASRTPANIQECIDAIKADYPDVDYRPLKLDLGSQEAVREAAKEVMSWDDVPEINLVVNSAGIMNLPERKFSPEGIELTFATNHIGHFLFTNLLMPKLLKSAESSPKGATRIINVTSLSPTVAGIRWSDINFDKISTDLPEDEQPNYQMMNMWGQGPAEGKSYLPIEAYNQSKAGNVLFSVGLNKRLADKGILSFACHPGIINTDLVRYASPEVRVAIKERVKGVYMKSLGAGSSTSIVCAADPGLGLPAEEADANGKENHGVYFIDCQVSDRANPRAVSSKNAERLWALSEDLVKEKFTY
jgi:NAD(P)-dependent dehydrogenase (short-subunit alcohol dehydrogenase family)